VSSTHIVGDIVPSVVSFRAFFVVVVVPRLPVMPSDMSYLGRDDRPWITGKDYNSRVGAAIIGEAPCEDDISAVTFRE
jgi:hypothetical protein